jgi:hypothetical protein
MGNEDSKIMHLSLQGSAQSQSNRLVLSKRRGLLFFTHAWISGGGIFYVWIKSMDILVNLDGEQNNMLGENLRHL